MYQYITNKYWLIMVIHWLILNVSVYLSLNLWLYDVIWLFLKLGDP